MDVFRLAEPRFIPPRPATAAYSTQEGGSAALFRFGRELTLWGIRTEKFCSYTLSAARRSKSCLASRTITQRGGLAHGAEIRLPTLTIVAAVTVISSIATVPVIFTRFGRRAIPVPVLSLLRPTVSAAGLILPADLMLAMDLILATGLILATLSVVWVHRVIEIADDVVDALCGSRMCNWNRGHQYNGSSSAKQSSTR
jgi:hypothetical protein